MPLLKKKEFRKSTVTDGFRDSDEVFYCPITNEIFQEYDEFCARIILCNSMVWTCSYTGKTGLTYSEALESEARAKHLFKDFPTDLRIPVLFIASRTKRSSFQDMLDDIHGYIKDRYFIGENVEASFSGNKWENCHVLQVIAPTAEKLAKSPKNGQAHYSHPASMYHYEVEQLDPEDEDLTEIMIVNCDHIRRKKRIGRDKLKLFLKQYIEINELGIYVIKPAVLIKFGIHKMRFDQIYDESTPGFEIATKLIKSVKNTKQGTIDSFLKNENGHGSNNSQALIEKRRKLQEDFERKKEELRQKRNEDRRKLRQENLKLSNMVKEWYKPKEDLMLDDHKILPVHTPVCTQIPDEHMGDVFAILEFVKTFSKFLSVNVFFAGGLKLEVLERALIRKEVAGPLMDLIQMFLTALINFQVDEAAQYNTKLDKSIVDRKMRIYKNNPSLTEASDIATFAANWSFTHLGVSLTTLPLYSLTTSEILRLHLLSSGARINDTGARLRYQYRGGYLSEDDPGLYFRLHYPHILKALSLHCVTELPMGDILKIIDCLMSQLLTYSDVRDFIEDQQEIDKQAKIDYKTAQLNERKHQNEYTAAEFRIKKEKKDDQEEQLDKLKREHENDKTQNEKKMNRFLNVVNKHQTFLGQDRAFRKYIKLESVPGIFINFEEENPGYCYNECIQQNRDLFYANSSDITAHFRKIIDNGDESTFSDATTPSKVLNTENNYNLLNGKINSNLIRNKTSPFVPNSEVNSNALGNAINSKEIKSEINPNSETDSNEQKSETNLNYVLNGEVNSNAFENGINSNEPKTDIPKSETDSNEQKSEMGSNEIKSETDLNYKLNGEVNSKILDDKMYSNAPNVCEQNGVMDPIELKSEMDSNEPTCAVQSNGLKSEMNLNNVVNGEVNSNELKSEMDPNKSVNSNGLKNQTNLHNMLNSDVNSNVQNEVNNEMLLNCESSPDLFSNDPDKLLMCNSNPETCVVHHSTVTRDKWAFVNSSEQISELVNCLNSRGNRESELKQNIANNQEYLSKLVGKTASYVNIKRGLPEENAEDGSELKSKNNARKQKYENATLGYPKELSTALILQYVLVENILELEGNLFAGNLGSIKVNDRTAWRMYLANHSFDLRNMSFKKDRRVSSIIKESSNRSRSSTPDINKEYQDPGKFLELSGDIRSSSDTTIKCEEYVLSHTDDHKLAVQTLARALVQIAEGVDRKYLKKPLGTITMRSDTRLTKSDVLTEWKNSLLASTSYCQIFLHYSVLENCILWSRSALRAYCTACRKKSNSNKMLICDNCNKGQHLYCHKPKLKHVPKGNWYCNVCRKQKEAEEQLKNPIPTSKKRHRIFLDDEDTSEQSDNNTSEQTTRRGDRKRRKISSDTEQNEHSDTNIFNGRSLGKSRKRPIPIIQDDSSEQSDVNNIANGGTKNLRKPKKSVPVLEEECSEQSDTDIVNRRFMDKSSKSKRTPIIEDDSSETPYATDHDVRVLKDEDDSELQKEDESQIEECSETGSECGIEEQEEDEFNENSEAEQNETEPSESESDTDEDVADETVEQDDIDMGDEVTLESEIEHSQESVINEGGGDELTNGEGQTIEVCEKCGVGGTLLCCDNCPDLYHLECANPPLKRIPRGDWFCHKCKNSKKKEGLDDDWYQSHSVAQRSGLIHNQRRCAARSRKSVHGFDKILRRISKCEDNSRRSIRRDDLPLNNLQLQQVLAEVMKQDYAWPFLRRVNKNEVPDYYDIIENPMDFGTIKYKLNMGNYAYDSDLMSDVSLVFENCKIYNSVEDEVFQCGLKMLTCFVAKAQELGLFVPHSLVSLEVLIGEDQLRTNSDVDDVEVE